MTLTTYGYKKPDSGDRAKGVTGWYAAYNFNVDRLNTHNHDGANSAFISPSAITPFSNTVLAAAWSVSGSGYKQTVTVPAGVADVANYILKFVFTAPAGVVGQNAYLLWNRITATTYDLYCNDNTAAFTVYYK